MGTAIIKREGPRIRVNLPRVFAARQVHIKAREDIGRIFEGFEIVAQRLRVLLEQAQGVSLEIGRGVILSPPALEYVLQVCITKVNQLGKNLKTISIELDPERRQVVVVFQTRNEENPLRFEQDKERERQIIHLPGQTTLKLLQALQTKTGDELGQVIDALADEDMPNATIRRRAINLILNLFGESFTTKPDVIGAMDKISSYSFMLTGISVEKQSEREVPFDLTHAEKAENYVKQMNRLVHFFRKHLTPEDIDLATKALNRWELNTNRAELETAIELFHCLPRSFFFVAAQEHKIAYIQFLKALEEKADEEELGVPRKMWALHGWLSTFVDVEIVPLGKKTKDRVAAAIGSAFGEYRTCWPKQSSLIDAISLGDVRYENNMLRLSPDLVDNQQETFAVLFKTIYGKGYSLNIQVIGYYPPEPLAAAIAEILVDNYFSDNSPAANEAGDLKINIDGFRASITINRQMERPTITIVFGTISPTP